MKSIMKVVISITFHKVDENSKWGRIVTHDLDVVKVVLRKERVS